MPSQRDDFEGMSACFPADAAVTLGDGATIRMDRLRVGDVVRTGVGHATSAVFMFTHADGNIRSKFVRLTTTLGQELTLSPSHFLYSNGRVTRAQDVQVGDSLVSASTSAANESRVAKVDRVHGTGLFNPQTMSGDIVVSGLVTTTFTSAVDPALAHALLAPVRTMHRIGLSTSLFDFPRGGDTWLTKWPALSALLAAE
jgi:Hint module